MFSHSDTGSEPTCIVDLPRPRWCIRGDGVPWGRSGSSNDLDAGHWELAVTDIHEQAAVLALVSRTDSDWYRLASLIEEAGSALRVIKRDWSGFESFEYLSKADAEALGARVTEKDLEEYELLIAELKADGARLHTVLDETYPLNLRLIYNRPPFLFVRGELLEADNRSIAVVGTRAASDEGLRQAAQLSAELAQNGVTVLSGLAHGIDAAAHRATLEAGGRTVAVMGTGVRIPVYPAANRELAVDILDQGGALVSQFWPDHPPMGPSFPMRNIVMSGMGLGTVVVEANSTSGAKNQARRALEHGKRLFLVESLVMHEQWAHKYAEHPATTVVTSVEDILPFVRSITEPPEQLSLA